MKKLFKKSFLVVLFLAGFASVSMAEDCFTVAVDCGDGTGGYALACGDTVEEIIDEAWELAELICE